MKSTFLYLTLLSSFALISQGLPTQQVFMGPSDHGDIWSLCDNPSSHLLIGYKNGVSITPENPRTNDDIHVQVKGNLRMFCNISNV